ncbi:MAG: flagellar motor switch protein FliM [Anaerolineae bacterium]|jgi:flagellar motor switch protein FliM|nr:MAG: flagellar motor switch protein FliM [Anaerolineae bacterium]
MLSQAEIDALLAGAIEIEQSASEGSVNLAELMEQQSGKAEKAVSEKQVRPYNFWSPDHFSKDQMRAVELVHEDLAERLTSSLPTFVRSNMRPRVVHTEQGRFHDFLKDLPAGSLFHMITLAPLPGQMVMTISPEISYTILEQRLGGQSSRGGKVRVLTEIDQFLLRGLVEHMLNDIKAAWSKVVAIEPSLEDSTTNQHWVQMVMGNERVMLVAFELNLNNVSGLMNIYIPFPMLKPIANILKPHIWFTGRKEKQVDPDARRKNIENLTVVRLTTRVFLGTAKRTFGELMKLKVGDVITLDTSIHQDVVVQISNKKCFLGKIGKSGKYYAVQITEKILNNGNP